jgi:hypothetical protein
MSPQPGNRCKFVFRTVAALSLLAFFLAIPAVLLAEDDSDSLAYPADSTPFGMTYGDWQAAYWQYVFSITASINPALDTTGQYCDIAQSGGPVFFLNPSFPGMSVTRSCTVSKSKALLVPLALWECSNLEPDPFHGDNPQEMRKCAATGGDGIGPNTLKLIVDGKKVSGVRKVRSQSPYYFFTLPADNILGLPGPTTGNSVSDAYIIMLKPLSPGKHVIQFEAGWVSGPLAGLSAGATYNLTVE